MRTVHPGHAAVLRVELSAVNRPGLRRPATTATDRAIRTAGARMSRRNVRSRLTTTIAVIRSRILTIRRPRARTRSRELIPHRAAAILLRLALTPRLAVVIAAAA